MIEEDHDSCHLWEVLGSPMQTPVLALFFFGNSLPTVPDQSLFQLLLEQISSIQHSILNLQNGAMILGVKRLLLALLTSSNRNFEPSEMAVLLLESRVTSGLLSVERTKCVAAAANTKDMADLREFSAVNLV